MTDSLARLEPTLLWKQFSELTRIARPSKAEGPAREHVLAWAAARSLEATSDDEGNIVVRIPASAGRESATHRDPPIAPRHGVRARSRQSVRSARGSDRRPRRGRLGARGRHDAGSRQRDRGRGGTGGGGRRRDRPRSARAPLHRLRGAGPRRREGARRLPRIRSTARQPRRDERRRAHDRLRGQRPHAPPRPADDRPDPTGPRCAARLVVRREGWALGRGHRRGPGERDQGARPRARRRRSATRSDRRRRQPERHTPRSTRDRRCSGAR